MLLQQESLERRIPNLQRVPMAQTQYFPLRFGIELAEE